MHPSTLSQGGGMMFLVPRTSLRLSFGKYWRIRNSKKGISSIWYYPTDFYKVFLFLFGFCNYEDYNWILGPAPFPTQKEVLQNQTRILSLWSLPLLKWQLCWCPAPTGVYWCLAMLNGSHSCARCGPCKATVLSWAKLLVKSSLLEMKLAGTLSPCYDNGPPTLVMNPCLNTLWFP